MPRPVGAWDGDTVLARHYHFTPEELDFIINYDIKYRLGRDAETGPPRQGLPSARIFRRVLP
jgi:hypothetical protein